MGNGIYEQLKGEIGELKAKNIMTRDILTIEGGALVYNALMRMMDRRVTSLLVEDDNEIIEGIVTRRDILCRALAKEIDPYTTKVNEIMSAPLKTVNDDSKVIDVVKLMEEYNIRRFPVVDGNGKFVGLVSNSDAFRAYGTHSRELKKPTETD